MTIQAITCYKASCNSCGEFYGYEFEEDHFHSIGELESEVQNHDWIRIRGSGSLYCVLCVESLSFSGKLFEDEYGVWMET